MDWQLTILYFIFGHSIFRSNRSSSSIVILYVKTPRILPPYHNFSLTSIRYITFDGFDIYVRVFRCFSKFLARFLVRIGFSTVFKVTQFCFRSRTHITRCFLHLIHMAQYVSFIHTLHSLNCTQQWEVETKKENRRREEEKKTYCCQCRWNNHK